MNRLVSVSLVALASALVLAAYSASAGEAKEAKASSKANTKGSSKGAAKTPVKAAPKDAKKKLEKKPLAKSSTPVVSPAVPSKPQRTLMREVVFDGSTVNGHYHAAGEAVAKVEQEKQMHDLIGLRRDYKDRLAAERERLKRGEPAIAD